MDTTQTSHVQSLPTACNCRLRPACSNLRSALRSSSVQCNSSHFPNCRAPRIRSKPISRHQRGLRRQEKQIQHTCQVQQRSQKQSRMQVTCAAAVAELATEKATVKIGTRGSPLALAQAYMTRDFLKVCQAAVPMCMIR